MVRHPMHIKYFLWPSVAFGFLLFRIFDLLTKEIIHLGESYDFREYTHQKGKEVRDAKHKRLLFLLLIGIPSSFNSYYAAVHL